ncbi:MAG TPA: peptidase S10 [Caulobacteraceae bacterium]|nr:peptidase S10 [Caulobacteraceae bacterium]
MRLGALVGVLMLGLALPAAGAARTADAGPDRVLSRQAPAASAQHRQPERSHAPTWSETLEQSRSRGERAGRDCDLGPGGGASPQPGETGAAPKRDPRAELARCRKLTDADIVTAPITEVRRVTRHDVVIDGKKLAYVATAGTLTIRDDQGKPTASMFYVAYTTGDPHRPVTFLYNGGPGSSSVWLHMGSLGPVRVLTDSPAPTHGPPYQIVNNDQSLLDKSDLVFLDAVGAGFSRPLGDTPLAAFWGTDQDIDAFARAIERWLTINGRWNAPKFLFGESYGTTRSAGLSYRLQQDGVQLNGVILLSSILNYGRRQPGFDQEMINYLPSYAAAAAYHHKLANPPADLSNFLAQVRDFARGPYAEALAEGQTLSQAERRRIAQQLSGYIGLPVDYLLQSDLRVTPGRFRKELLRDRRLTIGRFDDRFTGVDMDAAGATPGYDPSDSGITGAFVAAFHDYLSRDLQYQTDLAYRVAYSAPGVAWDYRHRAPGGAGGGTDQADVALDLSQAMRENPHLLLYSLNGIYDLATPFFGTEYDLGHMQLSPKLAQNVRFAYFPSGHMVYLNPEALKEMKADLVRFYDEAAPPTG